MVISKCRVVSWLVGKGCLLSPPCSFDRTLLALALIRFVLPGQTCLLFQVFLDFLVFHSSPIWWKGHLFWVLVLEGLVGLHRTIQLQLLCHQWLGHGLGLPWCWMASLGNELRPFCHFWDCTQVLHFGVFYWLWGPLHFFSGFLAHSSRYE